MMAVTQNRSYAEVVKGTQEKEMAGDQSIQSMVIRNRSRSNDRENKKHEGQDKHRRLKDSSRHEHRQTANRKIWKERGRGETWAGMEFKIKPEEYAWLEGNYVGIVHYVEMVRNLQEKFYMEGYFSCQIRAMGGKMVLLTGQDKEEVKDLVEMATDWLRQWFEEVKPWSSQMTTNERFAWIRCQGAPVNVWGSEFFSTMGSTWGKFMCLDNSTSKKERFDIARFFISTSIMETIKVTREVKINGSIFKLKFTEEEFTNCFFSLKHDFMPSFNSDSEDNETWSTGTESEMQDEEDERREKEVQAGCSIDEDDDVIGRRRDKERRNVVQTSKKVGDSTETVGDNLEKIQISNAIVRSRWTNGVATGQTVQGSFSERRESKSEENIHKMKPSNQSVLEEINSKNGRRKIRRCSSVYIQPRNSEATTGKKRGRKKKNMQQMEERSIPIFMPNQDGKVAGDSVGDSEIHNCNRALKKQWQNQLAKEIWDLATQLGAVAKNDNDVVQRIEEMEARDQSAKRIMANREVEVGGKVDWGPKPFRFFDAWLEQPRCKEVITSAWCDNEVEGWNGFKIKEKLKRTKKALKERSGKTNREMDGRIKKAERVIALVDEKGEQHQLTENDIELRRNSFIELWKYLKIKERMSQQKARKLWLKEGDVNTKFFHRSIKGRWSRNEINSIRINGEQHIGVEVIKREIAKYFQELFTEEKWRRPKLDGIHFRQITKTDNEFLTTTFSKQEIKEAIWNCDPSKSPRPDGFNFKFIMTMWDVIKTDIFNFVWEFQQHGNLVKGSNASFIVLIPKTENAQAIEEFRPISLIGMAFIEGRHLVEGAVIANEIIDEVKRKKKKGFLFKVNFEKAYDKECLKSSSVPILINGSPTNQFSVNKGIRQGDPLSPFLFLIVAEGLNGLVASAVEKEKYKGVVIGSGDVMVTHLQFADDTIFFEDETEDNIWVIKCIMRTFKLTLGLKINFRKSQLIGVGVYQNWCAKMAYQLCCKEGKLPFRKAKGGLGVKDLRKFNLALMGKWWGRLAENGEGIWKKIIVEKYGKGGGHWQDWIDENRGVGSTWWRDVCGINTMDGGSNGWLKEGFRVKVGESNTVSFWWDKWRGEECLANRFPRLYLLSTEKTKMCSEMGSRTNGLWEWKLNWRRNLFDWEKEEAMELHNTIQSVQTSQGCMDSWEWTHSKDGQYSTKSAYAILTKEEREASKTTTFTRIWNSILPSKILAFN
ncbi:hypothetical protein SLEP1_g12166 [Rubroshorea leprosula]|nr:hypothetical protein SLEP1_g12166 [Rubroshorea leprosula]